MEVGCTPKTPRVCVEDTHGAQAGARKGTGSWQHGRPWALHPPTHVGAHPVIGSPPRNYGVHCKITEWGRSLPAPLPGHPACAACPHSTFLQPPTFWGQGAQPHYEHPRDTAWRVWGQRAPAHGLVWAPGLAHQCGGTVGWGRPPTPQRAVPTRHSQKGWRRGGWAMERLRKQGDVPLGGPLCPPGAGGGSVTAVPPRWGWALGTASCCHRSGEPGLSTSCARPPKEVRPCPV